MRGENANVQVRKGDRILGTHRSEVGLARLIARILATAAEGASDE